MSTTKRGRPRKTDKARRDYKLPVRFSIEELQRVRRAARKARMRLSDFARSRLDADG